jgi:hypothetical protein
MNHMSKSFSARKLGAALAVLTAVFFFMTSASATVSDPGQDSPMLFTGASFGPTPEVAIQGAIGDAETSASAYQLFTCRMVGDPQIFPGPNPEWGRNYSAQVTVACTP